MSMTDPLADLISRIRNGQAAGKAEVSIPLSGLKASVCGILATEGYIEGFRIEGQGAKATIQVILKYFKGRPVIDTFARVSTPGRRVYRSRNDLPSVLGGFGIAIVSTSKGVMTDHQAREGGHGGEVLCVVS